MSESDASTVTRPDEGGPRLLVVYTAAALLAVGLGMALIRLSVPNEFPSIPILLQLLCLLFGLTLGVLLHHRERIPQLPYAVTLSVGVFLCLGLYGLLKPTRFGLYAFDADAWFCNAAVTKFATSWAYTDFAYQGLPSFYPPLYFYVLGKLAMLTEGPAFLVWRNALIVGGFVYPILFFWLFRRVLGAAAAAVFVFLLFLIWNDKFLYKPHSFLSYVLFVWWMLSFFHPHAKRPSSILAGGVVGALVLQLYYYPCFVLTVAVTLVIAHHLLRGKIGDLKQHLPIFYTLAAALLFSAVFWVPLLVSMSGPGTESLSNRWFTSEHVDFWQPFRGALSLTTVLTLGGLAYLIIQTDLAARFMKVVIASCFVWYGISYLGVIGFDVHLLHFRINDIVPLLILPYVALGLVRLHAKLKETRVANHVDRWVLLAVVLVGAASAQSYFMGQYRSDLYKTANRERYIADPKLSAFTSSTLDQKIVLSGMDSRRITAQFPVYTFIVHNAFYSHPASRYSERLQFLGELSEVRDPQSFAQQLKDNQFDKIDFVLLQRAGGEDHADHAGSYYMALGVSAYPHGAKRRTIYFDPSVFSSSHFTRIEFPQGELFRVNYEK